MCAHYLTLRYIVLKLQEHTFSRKKRDRMSSLPQQEHIGVFPAFFKAGLEEHKYNGYQVIRSFCMIFEVYILPN